MKQASLAFFARLFNESARLFCKTKQLAYYAVDLSQKNNIMKAPALKKSNIIIIAMVGLFVSCAQPAKEIAGQYFGTCTTGTTTYDSIYVNVNEGGNYESVSVSVEGKGALNSVTMYECQVRKNQDGTYHLYDPAYATYYLEGSVNGNSITFSFEPLIWNMHSYTGIRQ